MANVVLLSLTFSPDNVSTAQIMAGIASDLREAGHAVCVLTSTPHFHRDSSMEEKQPIRKWWGPFVRRSELNGVSVYHVWMPDKSIWPPLRMLSWIWFHFVCTVVSFFLKKPEVVLACSPPLTIGVNAWLISVLRRCRYIYNVQELYPDIAMNLGMIRNRLAIRFFQGMERFVYRHAAVVTSITEGMCEKIRERVAPEKVFLIPNYVDLDSLPGASALDGKHAFADEFGLRGSFVVTYAGNMGIPQKLDVLLESAAKLPPGVLLLFVGAGGAKESLLKRADELKLENVRFVEYQPISRMPEIYAASSLFYVGQDPQASSDGIPSKIYRILGNRKPILAVTTQGSDLARFVQDSGAGVVVDDFSPETVAGEIRKLVNNGERLSEFSERGFRFVSTTFSRRAISSQYEKLVRKIVG